MRTTINVSLRRSIDATLIEAIHRGAKTVMDDADWTSIRKSARTNALRANAVHTPAKSKRKK